MSRFRNSWFVAVLWLVPAICALAFALLAFLVSMVRGGEISTTSAASVAFVDNASYLQGKEVIALEAAPEKVLLRGPLDYSQLVLTAELEDGERIDVTQLAMLVDDNEKATVTDDRRVMPIAAGDEEITFEFGGAKATVHVILKGDADPQPIRFITDVQPIFGRVGCNSGTCHGSQAGKNGFKLSLRGYDPLYDHRSLADDHAARRTNRAAPEQSLMLLKATGQVPHEGGAVLELGSPYYKIIRTWIAEGVRYQADAPRVTSIEVTPKSATIPLPGMSQRFRVVATYTDGTSRDVTREAFLESGDNETATADRTARLTAVRRGVAPVLVRYEGAYAVATATVMGDRDGFEWADAPAFNFVDELVYDKLKQLKIAPGKLCTDAEFIRRATLDLTGLPPTPDEIRAFLDDGRDPQSKRDELIDRLVGSPAYIDHKTNKWADLLQVNGKFLSREGATAFREWIRKHMEANTPYDQFAREILTASGSNRVNPAASYFKILRDPEPTMENTTHLFLGIRFNCNKCHDHPFERWTQNQYYDLAAYFAQVELKRDPESGDRKIGGTAVEGAKPLYEEVLDKSDGEVRHERTGEITPPKFPYEHDFDCPQDATRRQQLATWITSPENRYFTRSFVNRQWAYLLGVGIIEPIDDIRAGNPPSNPELLERLAQEFIDSRFDVQHLVRTICKSRTYQLSIATNDWNDDDARNYSHAYPRRLPAEVMLDAVHRVTGSPSHFPGVPPGTRAAQLPDAGIKLPDGFLDDLGRPARESACECERVDSLMLGPVMKLVNGPTIADAIVDPQNELAKLEGEVGDDSALVEELFLRILNRRPSADELAAGVATLAQGSDDVEKAQADFAERQKAVDAQLDAWLAGQQIVRWHTLGRVEAASTNGAVLIPQPDHSLLAQGPEGKTAYTIVAYNDLPELTGLRLEALADDRLPNKGPGRAGNFVLTEIRVSAAPLANPAAAMIVPLKKPIADFSQNGFSIATAVNGKSDQGWGIHPQVGRDHTALFTFAEPVVFDGGTRLVIVLDQQHSDGKHALGRFRLSVTGTDLAIDLDPHPAEIMAILRTRPGRRNDQQKASLVDYHRRRDAEYVSRQLAASRVNNPRLVGVQDLAWALINSPAFLFNR